MSYTETTTTSYGQRLGKALSGVVGGLAAFLIGTILLFWNEGNFVKSRKALNEAQGVAVAVDNVEALDPEIEGKLIHATANAATEDKLKDPFSGVEATAIALKRQVEYYQFEQHSSTQTRDKLGGGQEKVTTYSYKTGWHGRPINSSDFKDPEYQGRNFILHDVSSEDFYANNVSFGAYVLPDFFIRSISKSEPLDVTLSDELTEQLTQSLFKNERANLRVAGEETPKVVHTTGSTVYLGLNPATPQVGDIRISLKAVFPQVVSIIGRVNGNTFGRYTTKNGRSVSRLDTGAVSMEEMFASAHRENSFLTWLLRLVGTIAVCAGLAGIFGILEAIAKVVPFLGSVVGAGVRVVSTLVGVAWSVLWIAIAWISYRPLVGIPLLAVSIALIVMARKKKATA